MQKTRTSFSLFWEKEIWICLQKLSSCSVDSEYVVLSPGQEAWCPWQGAWQPPSHHFLPCKTFSDRAEFLWVTVFQAGLELTLRHRAFPRQNKEDLQGFLDCNLGNPVPQSNAFPQLLSLLLLWILPWGKIFFGDLPLVANKFASWLLI